jgi:hypothetical protein
MASLEDLTPNQIMQLAAMTYQLSQDPTTREQYLRLVKQKNPNVSIPEVDAKDAVLTQLNELKEDNRKLRDEIKESKFSDNVEKKRAGVMTKHRLSDDQMTVIEKLMIDKKLPDYDTAVEFYTLQQKVATPTSLDSVANPDWSMPDKNIWNAGIGNKAQLDKIARSEAYKAFNEIHGMPQQASGLGRAE